MLPARAETVAATPKATEPLTLGTAVAVALENNPALRAARLRVSVGYWQRLQEALLPNPTVALTLDPVEWSARLAGELGAIVDLGGARHSRIEAARSREEQLALEALRLAVQLVQDTRTAYADVLAGRRQEVLLKEKAAIWEVLAHTSRARLTLGDLSEVQVLEVETASQDATTQAADAATRRQQAVSRLAKLLGQPASATIAIEDEFALAGPIAEGAIESTGAIALASRPELAVLAARLKEHRALLAAAKVAWIPRLNGGPYVAHYGAEGNVVGGALTVTLPVFDRGQGLQGIEEATLKALEQELLTAEAQVLLELQTAYLEVRRAESRFASEQTAQVQRAHRMRLLSEQARAAGGMSEEDVRRARIRELEVLIAQAQAQRGFWQARIALAATVGDRGGADNELRDASLHAKP